jgi:alpha-amylase
MAKVTWQFRFLIPILFLVSCKQKDNSTNNTVPTYKKPQMTFPALPDWAKPAVLYEINVRQFSKEGTLNAITKDLPRLKSLGVDILWLMPIHPISIIKRKGSLGSPYAVADYLKINPDYGTLNDFKLLVNEAHKLDLKVIMDWVPNHTGWDNPWITSNPDWYTHLNGKITEPLNEKGESTGWTDVADLNYDSIPMQDKMISALQYWVKNANIDGYRFDMAGMVPMDFWQKVRPALDTIKPVFLLAEWEDEPKQLTFCHNANYGWKLFHLSKDVVKGEKSAEEIWETLSENRTKFPNHAFQLRFTQNHDENTWEGTTKKLYGDGADAANVLMFTLDGIPMIYNGMESNLNQQLEFFEKDPIKWKKFEKTKFFKTLCELKHRNQALWNGVYGGIPQKIANGQEEKVISFVREKNGDKILVVINLSATNTSVNLKDSKINGIYSNIFNTGSMAVNGSLSLKLKPYEYLILSSK